jgi:hypothetical protein
MRRLSFPEANFLDEFLMKSSGLLNAFAPMFSEAAAKLVPVWLREPCRLPYSWRLKKRGVLCSGATWKQHDKECTGHCYRAAHLIRLWRKHQ